jgi:hypothetical protein
MPQDLTALCLSALKLARPYVLEGRGERSESMRAGLVIDQALAELWRAARGNGLALRGTPVDHYIPTLVDCDCGRQYVRAAVRTEALEVAAWTPLEASREIDRARAQLAIWL